MNGVEKTKRVVVLGLESKDADLAVNGAGDVVEAVVAAREAVGEFEVWFGDDEA